jgi:hypothetical protein
MRQEKIQLQRLPVFGDPERCQPVEQTDQRVRPAELRAFPDSCRHAQPWNQRQHGPEVHQPPNFWTHEHQLHQSSVSTNGILSESTAKIFQNEF